MTIDQRIKNLLPEIQKLRHEIHHAPELSWQEEKTAARVAEILNSLPGIEVQTGIGRNGVVGLLQGAKDGPTVGLRADMDALPLQEKTGLSYASKVDGVMHACGHDGHTANLIGVAKVLSEMRQDIAGQIKFIFQPAEEGGAGALEMCKDGVLESPAVDVIFGLHGWPQTKVGQVGIRVGALLASVSEFSVTLQGKGGHAAMYHLASDPILAGAKVIEGLHAIRAREIPPTDPFVLSVTMVHGGTATNVIPDQVSIQGTVRTIDTRVTDFAARRIDEIASGIAATFGIAAKTSFHRGYPPTVNHEQPTRYLAHIAEQIVGKDNVIELEEPTMGAEDFSYYLERVPGCYFFLGLDDGRDGGYPSLHNPYFDFNDQALQTGVRVLCQAALDYSHHHVR